MKHVIIAKVDNVPGVVSKISGLFTRRGYNIESLVTSVTGDPSIYHLTISVIAGEDELELLDNQLGRLMEVIEVRRTNETDYVRREFLLVKISCPTEKRGEIMQLAEMLKGKVVGMGINSAVLEVTGDGAKLDGVLRTLEAYGIIETVRSGAICIGLEE